MEFTAGVKSADVKLLDSEGNVVAEQTATPRSGKAEMKFDVENPAKWSAETPNLLQGYGRGQDGRGTAEVIAQRIGFRSSEIKNGQLLVNGQPVLIKGANRHEVDPLKGFVMSRERIRSRTYS